MDFSHTGMNFSHGGIAKNVGFTLGAVESTAHIIIYVRAANTIRNREGVNLDLSNISPVTIQMLEKDEKYFWFKF